MDETPLDPALVRDALAGGAGRDAPDGPLGEIDRLVEAGDVAAAAERARELLEGGVTDIRVIAPYLHGVFVARGPASLGAIFEAVHHALTEGFARLRPDERKARTVDAALRGTFRAMLHRWDFETEVQGDRRLPWPALDREGAGRALEASFALRDASTRALDRSRFPDQLSELEVRLRTALERAIMRPPARPAPPPPPPTTTEDADDDADDAPPDTGDAAHAGDADDAPPEPKARASRPRGEPPRATGPTLEVSPAMAVFLQKLAAFETLVERGDMTRAAVVAEDVRRVVESFDPRVYLPKLLARHFALLHAHVEELAPHWESTDGPAWRALEQLYQVDLDGFVGDE